MPLIAPPPLGSEMEGRVSAADCPEEPADASEVDEAKPPDGEPLTTGPLGAEPPLAVEGTRGLPAGCHAAVMRRALLAQRPPPRPARRRRHGRISGPPHDVSDHCDATSARPRKPSPCGSANPGIASPFLNPYRPTPRDRRAFHQAAEWHRHASAEVSLALPTAALASEKQNGAERASGISLGLAALLVLAASDPLVRGAGSVGAAAVTCSAYPPQEGGSRLRQCWFTGRYLQR